MAVTTTELRKRLAYYIELAQKEDVIIVSNNVAVAKLVSPVKNRIASLDSLVGILPEGVNEEESRLERIKK
ncbi:MAG TPA: type II toxin-antitoxin system prevent-host-death family antitoxin [Lachnospiraceae bacterium]|nr:type II toxin-antitoxin system prevent-host-death family antitoxin [Lachnospiraceae bacterium]